MADGIENKIKNFFRKKKANATFKAAGPGHKLNEPSIPKPKAPSKDAYRPPERIGLTDESKQAAKAALARYQGTSNSSSPGFNTSLAAIRAQAKRELEAEKTRLTSETCQGSDAKANEVENVPKPENLAVSGVFFRCSLISDEVLSQNEWDGRIREFLNEQLQSEPSLTAVLMVHTLNKNKEKVQACIEVLVKYMENIIHNPTEEKYRKIRKTNKIYLEKVNQIEGAELVIEGAGFVSEGDFYVFPEPTPEMLETLESLIDALKTAEPISLELDRNLQVLVPSQAQKKQELPREFFRLTMEDLKREQQTRLEAIEKSSMLMTKAMREKEALRELRNYRYSVIRIRFHDGIVLQGTFGVYEPYTAIIEFIKENLVNAEEEFFLSTPLGERFDNNDETALIELKLVPAVIMIFNAAGENHLKPEVVVLCRDIQ